jgi:hypothetical protein
MKTTKALEQSVGILTLAQQIGVLHKDIEGRNDEMFALLTQAKLAAGEGGWLKWLADNREVLGFGERQARFYLRSPEARASDQARHAEGERKRRAAAKDAKEVPGSEMPPDLVPDYENGAQPEGTTKPARKAPEPAEAQSEAPERQAEVANGEMSATKVLKAKATKSDEHGVAYLDSRGRRRPNRPLPDRVWNVMNMASTGIEYLGRFLIESRQRGHQDFPQWLQQAIDLNLQMAAVLDLLKGETVPTIEDLEAILNPDDGDPAEPEPAASPR